jgi:hypothetical protein
MHRMPVCIASGRRSPREWLPVLILALLVTSSASADVAIKEKTVSEGLGGFGNGTTNRTLFVAGDKSRSEDEFTYTGRFKTLAGGGKPRTTLVITRIDKEVVWNVDPEKKQYTELTFADMRQMMAAGAAETDRNAQARDADMTFTVDVKRTGAKQEVNGFPAEQVVITCVGKPKTSEKGETQGEFRMVMDEWLTKGTPGSKEIAEYYKRFAEKMGLGMEMSSIDAMARRMYGNGMKEIAAKLKDLDGFPVRSTFTIEGSPGRAEPQQAAAASQAQQDQARAEREKSREAEASEEKRRDAEAAAEIGSGTDKGGIAGKLGGFLGRKATRAAQKKTEEKAEKKAEEMSSSGSGAAAGGPLMKVVTEVVSISTSPAPAGSFEVPAGYKLQKRN